MIRARNVKYVTVNGCMSSCIIWRGFSRPIFIIIQKSNREEKTDNARTWLYVSVSIEPHICSQSNVDYSLTLPTSHANPLFNPYSQWRLVSLTHRSEFWSTVVSVKTIGRKIDLWEAVSWIECISFLIIINLVKHLLLKYKIFGKQCLP